MNLKVEVMSRNCIKIVNGQYTIYIHETFVVIDYKNPKTRTFCYSDGAVAVNNRIIIK